MNGIAIYGAGGLGKEIRGMCELQGIPVAGFIDDFKPHLSLRNNEQFDDVVISIADPKTRFQIVSEWSRKLVPFHTIKSRDLQLHPSVSIGTGCIICGGVKMTVEITIGNFVIVNLNSTIGHDVTIGDFCSLMPSVNISGEVKLGERVFVGTGATILQGISVGHDAVIGAGAVVTKDVLSGTIVKGIPAKPNQG